MSHTYSKIWMHLVFTTNSRLPQITSKIERPIYECLSSEFKKSGCLVKIINGMPDHVHCLYHQNLNMPVSETVKRIKGTSSHWINQNDLMPKKFSWQTGYGIFSISESQLDKVYNYILNQKKHHKKIHFDQEFKDLLRFHNVSENGQ